MSFTSRKRQWNWPPRGSRWWRGKRDILNYREGMPDTLSVSGFDLDTRIGESAFPAGRNGLGYRFRIPVINHVIDSVPVEGRPIRSNGRSGIRLAQLMSLQQFRLHCSPEFRDQVRGHFPAERARVQSPGRRRVSGRVAWPNEAWARQGW